MDIEKHTLKLNLSYVVGNNNTNSQQLSVMNSTTVCSGSGIGLTVSMCDATTVGTGNNYETALIHLH